MHLSLRLLPLAVAVLVPVLGQGQGQAPAQGIPVVTTAELKRMMDEKEDFVLADTLSPIEFAEDRIAGAVNVPPTALKAGRAKLPADRAKKIVFYCKGVKCTKSGKAAALAMKLGYGNVAVYNEGIPEWVKAGYAVESQRVYPAVEIPLLSPAELKTLLDAKKDVVVLDIRDEVDAAIGIVPGSRSIDLELLDSRFVELPRGKKIVLVDLHGKQTQQAGRFLRWKGFQDVARLDGGFASGWLKAGYPVEK